MDPSTSGEKKTFRDILRGNCITIEKGFAICSVDASKPCKYLQPENKLETGNFIRHIRAEHGEQAKARGLFREEVEMIAKRRKISKKLFVIDRQILVEAMITLITVHHLPLNCVEWEGFKLLLEPICKALNVRMNRPNLMRHLIAAATKIRDTIKNLVKGKLLCLKIDTATRHGRHILGVNIQFFDPERQEVVFYTIGMIELNERHTAKFLKQKIDEILALYEITTDQIFTVTCDNGANMVATVKELQSYLQLQILNLTVDEEMEDDLDSSINWTEAIENEFLSRITLVRCAVHTMQLSVMDVVKLHDSDIRSCTTVAKNCRKITYKALFDLRNQSLPPLYAKTRWGGVFEMLEHFIVNEEFYKDLGSQFPELDLANQWDFINEYISAFQPVYKATKDMQAKHTSLCDFYLTWIKAVMEAFIVATYERIKRLKSRDCAQSTQSSPAPTTLASNDLDAFLTNMFGGSLPEQGLAQRSENSFLRQLNALDLEPHQNHSFNVWKHWLSRKDTHPELYEVATILLAVPSNQVSVERAFSALGLVLTDKRTKLSKDALESILLIKLNKELLGKILPGLYNWLDEDFHDVPDEE